MYGLDLLVIETSQGEAIPVGGGLERPYLIFLKGRDELVNNWAITTSNRGHPLLECSAALPESKGCLLRLSASGQEVDHEGSLWIDRASLLVTLILALNKYRPVDQRPAWEEAVVRLDGLARFFVKRTCDPNLIIQVQPVVGYAHWEKQVETSALLPAEFVPMNGSLVKRWLIQPGEGEYGTHEARSEP